MDTRRAPRWLLAVATVAVLVMGLAPAADAASTGAAKPRLTSLAQLHGLVTKGRAPMTGYSREQFGQAWLDADRNGCDTRNDILRRDLTQRVYKPRTRDCVVLTGRLEDRYTGQTIDFARGPGDLVDIDHVVSLGDAWATGAGTWDIKKRAALANDPLNLLAVDAHNNRSKGDADAASWLPPNRTFRCKYVARQIAVKAKYGLAVTLAERAAMAHVLAACPNRRAMPDPTQAPTTVDQNIKAPASRGHSLTRSPPA